MQKNEKLSQKEKNRYGLGGNVAKFRIEGRNSK
jgi:hypothetical protein